MTASEKAEANPTPAPSTLSTSPENPFADVSQEMRLLYLGEKDLLTRSIDGSLKRTPEQIDRYRQIVAAIALAGQIINVAAADPVAFRKFAKETVGAIL